jgi:hypothetical protein
MRPSRTVRVVLPLARHLRIVLDFNVLLDVNVDGLGLERTGGGAETFGARGGVQVRSRGSWRCGS